MNNADGGNVKFKFTGDDKDLKKKTDGLSSKFNDLGLKLGKVVAAGTAVATAAVVKFVKDAASSFAEFEQLEGGLKAMLDDDAEGIERVFTKSRQAYEDLQMSQNQYLNSFESSYAIVKNGLSDNADAIEYTNKVLQLSADLFNTYGGSTEQYSNAINWALKGTYSYLDNLNLGIKGTQEGFVEAANASGVLARKISDVKELTNNEIIDVIQHYADSYGVWGKSADEAAGTVAGSLNMTKAAWSNLVNEFGKKDGDIDGAFDKFLTSAEKLGENLIPLLERILDNTVKHLPKIVNSLANKLPSLIQTLLPTIIQATVDILKGLVDAAPMLIETLTEMLPSIIESLLQAVVDINNALADKMDEIIPMIVDSIIKIIPILVEYTPLFVECGIKMMMGLAKGIGNAIGDIISNLISKIPPEFIDYLSLGFEQLKNLGKTIMQWFGNAIQSTKQWVLNKVVSIATSTLDSFGGLPRKIVEIGKQLISGLWSGIQDKKQWVIDKITGLGDSVIKAVKKIFGVASPSKEFMIIGNYNMMGLEKGMEDMQPEIQRTIDSLFDLSPTLTNAMDYSLSPTINVVNNVDVNTDPLGQVVSNIKTFSNGAKNDYNYGMGV